VAGAAVEGRGARGRWIWSPTLHARWQRLAIGGSAIVGEEERKEGTGKERSVGTDRRVPHHSEGEGAGSYGRDVVVVKAKAGALSRSCWWAAGRRARGR